MSRPTASNSAGVGFLLGGVVVVAMGVVALARSLALDEAQHRG